MRKTWNFFSKNEWAKCQNFPCIVQSSSRILESTFFKKRIFFSFFSRDSLALKKYSSCKTEIFQITNQAVLVWVTKPLNAALFYRYLAIISLHSQPMGFYVFRGITCVNWRYFNCSEPTLIQPTQRLVCQQKYNAGLQRILIWFCLLACMTFSCRFCSSLKAFVLAFFSALRSLLISFIPDFRAFRSSGVSWRFRKDRAVIRDASVCPPSLPHPSLLSLENNKTEKFILNRHCLT